jgi:hypothetical protein
MMGGPKKEYGSFGDRKNLVSLLEFELWIVQSTA